jgi:Dolichyl-phosphate-mannose-protein mannosyltransferase
VGAGRESLSGGLTALSRHPALILGGLVLALHLYANGGYDYFRDELYFIVCGRRLDWGYVDQPPLTPLIARAAETLFGQSLLGLRLVPALADAALVALGTIAASRLGGGLSARWLTGIALLAAPIFRVFGLFLTTDSVQPLGWLAATLLLLEAIDRDERRLWLALGVVIGVTLLDKYMIAFFAVAAALGLALTPERRLFARPGPWLAVAIATLMILPNLLWQNAHGWPFLELGAAAVGGKNLTYNPLGWFLQQILLIGPLTAPIWLAGLGACLFWPRLARVRWLAIAWLALMAVMIAIHGKPYYPAGIYPMLLAAGAVAIEALLRNRAARAGIGGLLVASAVVTLPFVLPVLPVDRFIAYEQTIGLVPETGERLRLGALPQWYADMFGWRDLAGLVGQAYQALPPEDRAKAAFLANNFGEAAAIDVFGGPWHLPPAISGHNNYFIWGPDGHDGSVVFRLTGASPEQMLEGYGEVQAVGRLDNPYAMPYENGLTLYLCRNRKQALTDGWAELKHYD